MVSTQPTISFKYFRLKKNIIPKDLKELFYLSWEDALWDILIHKKIKKGSLILVPDFYCSDVEENIKNHGYKIARYRILSNLKADKKSFSNSIVKYKPSVIVIFHPVGMKSNLLDNFDWIKKITGKSILIEDAVHRVVDAGDYKIIRTNHFVMDSLRKVVPLQGAHIIGNTSDLNFNPPPALQSYLYFIKVNINCMLMNICWTLGFNKWAEYLMLKGYGLIGDEIKPARGSLIAKFLSDRLDIKNIQKLREKQVNFYKEKLNNFLPFRLSLKNKDKKHLRGYPVILSISKAEKILHFLRKNGLLVRFELEGSNWSKKQKIIYLPLGFHVNDRIQDKICFLVNEAYRKV